jgi:hypothetical protein
MTRWGQTKRSKMHSATEIPIGISSSPVVDLPIETRLVLFRALSDYCKPEDEEGMLTETFDEWERTLGDRVDHSLLPSLITHKVQALKLNHKNYAISLRPEVAEFVEQAEKRLRGMAVPILLDLRETLKKSLNGHAR